MWLDVIHVFYENKAESQGGFGQPSPPPHIGHSPYLTNIFVHGYYNKDGALDVCHMAILRNINVALLNLRNGHVALSNLGNCHVPCHYLLKTHVARHYAPERPAAMSSLGV